MKSRIFTTISWRFAAVALFLACALFWQAPPARAQRQRGGGKSTDLDTQQADAELQTALALTQQGKFTEAIPHFLIAHNRATDEYLVSFNLSLCYVATGQYPLAIELLNALRTNGRGTADVANLLTQAYVGSGQQDQAYAAFQDAVRQAPRDEKMFVLISESCLDAGDYSLGLKVVELGLQHLPNSGQLHFERAMVYLEMDRMDDARHDLDQVGKLSAGTDVYYIAASQKALLDGNAAEALRISREGIQKGHPHFMLLTTFGEAVLRMGIQPGQPDFTEAQEALEKAVTGNPSYPSSQIDLGKIYMLDNRTADAIERFNAARQLDPQNPAVYANLAAAYRKNGDTQDEQEASAMLAKLNKAQADKIATAPGDTHAGYGGHTSHQQ